MIYDKRFKNYYHNGCKIIKILFFVAIEIYLLVAMIYGYD